MNCVREFSFVELPAKKEGFDVLMFVPKGLTAKQVLDKIKERVLRIEERDYPVFVCTTLRSEPKDATSLSKVISDRSPDEAYVIRLRNTPEQEESGLPDITLREQLIWELWRLERARKLPRNTDVVLCLGSHFETGFIPGVNWDNNGRLIVGSFATDRK